MESLKDRRTGIQEADRHTYAFADPDQGDMPFSTENGWLQILRKKAVNPTAYPEGLEELLRRGLCKVWMGGD